MANLDDPVDKLCRRVNDVGMCGVVDRWNDAYFDGLLSADARAALEDLELAAPDAQRVADRAFRAMRTARIPPMDLSVYMAWLIGFSAPRTAPSAWNHAVPPVTLPGRHRKLDEYVASNGWHSPAEQPVFVDLGCGFPPLTTVDSAENLPGWRVLGVDPAFDRYLVYDEAGNYACVDDEHRVRYYRAGTVDADQDSTRARFTRLLRELLPLLPADDSGEPREVGRDGARLVRNPMRQYERANLTLEQGEIGAFTVEGGADVIRCMNVFMYFDNAFRRRALEWMGTVFRPGGLVLCGSNWAHSASSRYTVYQKTGATLTAREFAISIENVRPLESSPWYSLHDDDVELRANATAVAALRGDEAFRSRFDARLDVLLAERGFCAREPDGHLGGAPQTMPAQRCSEQSAELACQLDREGFVDDAAATLRRAGQDAWRNAAGHLAMRPMALDELPRSVVR